MKSKHRRTHSQDFIVENPHFCFKMLENDPKNNHEIPELITASTQKIPIKVTLIETLFDKCNPQIQSYERKTRYSSLENIHNRHKLNCLLQIPQQHSDLEQKSKELKKKRILTPKNTLYKRQLQSTLSQQRKSKASKGSKKSSKTHKSKKVKQKKLENCSQRFEKLMAYLTSFQKRTLKN